MSNLSAKTNKPECPEDVLSYLPLIANETCPPDILEKIKDVIDTNPDCARELGEFRALSLAFKVSSERIRVPSETLLDNVLCRIETQESRGTLSAEAPWLSRISRQIAGWFTLPPLRGAMAVAVALILVLTGIIIHQSRRTAHYQTLAGTTQPTPGRIALKIIFTPETSLGNITAFLQSTRGQIIAGPGPGGVFTISFPTPEHLDAFLRDLKNRKNLIKFVEISE